MNKNRILLRDFARCSGIARCSVIARCPILPMLPSLVSYVFPFFSCTPSGLEPLTFHIALAYKSHFHTTTLRGSVEIQHSKSNIYFTWLIRIPSNLHYNLLIHAFKACCMLHENMHRICGSLVNKRERMIYLFLPITSTRSTINKFYYSQVHQPSISSMTFLNFYKLSTQIVADHDQCIQWCKEQNLLASSIKCPRENCSNTLTWTRRASSRDRYEW